MTANISEIISDHVLDEWKNDHVLERSYYRVYTAKERSCVGVRANMLMKRKAHKR